MIYKEQGTETIPLSIALGLCVVAIFVGRFSNDIQIDMSMHNVPNVGATVYYIDFDPKSNKRVIVKDVIDSIWVYKDRKLRISTSKNWDSAGELNRLRGPSELYSTHEDARKSLGKDND